MDKIPSVSPSTFLEKAKTIPVVDVRSPAEFTEGHIPGALNIPLFDDSERAVVGTSYKNSGREAAIYEGLGIVGPKMQDFVRRARQIAPGRKLLIHCWRGGMRSGSMAWLLKTAGFDVQILDGGYKNYRRYIRESWDDPAHLIVISGKTGTGKSEILRNIQKRGFQVLDLELFAHHKGSAFGAIGESPQPTNEQFENDLAALWLSMDLSKPVWLEDESRFIGRVSIPEPLYLKKQGALTLCVEIPREMRILRLVKDYAGFPEEQLIQSMEKIGKRIGWDKMKMAIDALRSKDFEAAADIALAYYDSTYAYDLGKKQGADIRIVAADTHNADTLADMLLQLYTANQTVKA